MYHVRLLLTVVCPDGIAMLMRDTQLPFPPYPNLLLEFSEAHEDNVQLEHVFWQIHAQRFLLHCLEDHREGVLDDTIAWQEELGWRVIRVNRGDQGETASGGQVG